MTSVIKILRKEKHIQQNKLAELLGVTRQTLNKYEKDHDFIPIPLIKKLASIFDVEYTCIIENKLPSEIEEEIASKINDNEITDEEKNEKTKIAYLDEIDQKNEKFIQMFLYILIKVGAKATITRSVLGKLLYFINYDYFLETGKNFFFTKFTREKSGPMPVDFDEICKKMQKRGLIDIYISKVYHHENAKYIPIVNADFSIFSAEELYFINSELNIYSLYTNEDFNEMLKTNEPYTKTPLTPSFDIIDL